MLTIGIPLVGDLPQECVTDLLVAGAEASKMMDELMFVCPQSVMPHDRARELIITEALKMKSDFLWFIDADTRPPNGALKKLLDVLQEKKCTMVSGYYVQRGYPFVSTWGKKKEGEDLEKENVLVPIKEDESVIKIDTCGLGCALIDMKWVSDNLIAPFFLMQPDPDVPTLYRWEDAFFCKKIMDAGGVVYGVTDVVSVHMGRRVEVTPTSAEILRARIKVNGDDHTDLFIK